MKGLKVLIKVKRKELDDIKLKIFTLEKNKDHFTNIIHQNEQHVINQLDFLSKNPEMNFAFGPFYEKAASVTKILKIEIQKIEDNISKLREEVLNSFSELKKFEILLEQKEEQERIKLSYEEDKMYDEAGINQYLKSNEER